MISLRSGLFRSRKAQMTVWVIVAVIIVAAIIIYFLLFKKQNPLPVSTDLYEPKTFIERCTRDATIEAVSLMLPQGGLLNPDNYYEYEGVKIPYLCFNRGAYRRCITQHPLLIEEITKNLQNYLQPKIEDCFQQLQQGFETRQTRISYAGQTNFSVDLGEDRVYIKISKPTMITRGEETSSLKDYNVEVDSPLYNLANIEITISNEEAKNCYFEYSGYSLLYPRYKVVPTRLSDGTLIYTISDRRTNQKTNMAVRGCYIPAGL